MINVLCIWKMSEMFCDLYVLPYRPPLCQNSVWCWYSDSFVSVAMMICWFQIYAAFQIKVKEQFGQKWDVHVFPLEPKKFGVCLKFDSLVCRENYEANEAKTEQKCRPANFYAFCTRATKYALKNTPSLLFSNRQKWFTAVSLFWTLRY